MQREGFGIRLGAYLLDVIIILIVAFLLLGGSIFAALTGAGAGGTAQAGAEAVSIGFLILFFVFAVGYSLTEIFMAGSPGKRVLGIMIADENGTRASIGQLTKRWAIKNAGNLIDIVGTLTGLAFLGTIGKLVNFAIVIGCFFVLGAARQAFHDKLAGTAVFKRSAILTTGGPQGFQVMPASGGYNPPPPPVP